MGNTYEVISDKLAGHKRGDRIEGQLHQALVGVHVRILEVGREKCEACAASGTAAQKKAKYTAEELAAHYHDEHPGLAAPSA